jgi:hypothetical protein
MSQSNGLKSLVLLISQRPVIEKNLKDADESSLGKASTKLLKAITEGDVATGKRFMNLC